MRILHLAKYYWPRAGGMERVVQSLAEGAAALGHEVQVVAVQPLGRPGPRRGRTSVTRAWSFGQLGAQEIAPGYITGVWKRADIIHVHHPHPLADLAYLLRPGSAPVVVTHHSDSWRGIYHPLSRLVLRRASSIVLPSPAHLALSKELRGFEDKTEIIPFGIDETPWLSVPPAEPEQYPRALFIGRLVAWKGVDFLLRALERVPDLRLDVVGTGPEMARLRTLAQALAVADRVRWFGESANEDLPRRMAEANFVVLPSTTAQELFGLVVLEAMAAGRPVITTAVPTGVREVNVPGETGIEVPIRDVRALADAMSLLAADPELCARLGAAGRKRMRRLYTQSLMVDRHLLLYDRVRGTVSDDQLRLA